MLLLLLFIAVDVVVYAIVVVTVIEIYSLSRTFSTSPNPSVSRRTKYLSERLGWAVTQIQIPLVQDCIDDPRANP